MGNSSGQGSSPSSQTLFGIPIRRPRLTIVVVGFWTGVPRAPSQVWGYKRDRAGDSIALEEGHTARRRDIGISFDSLNTPKRTTRIYQKIPHNLQIAHSASFGQNTFSISLGKNKKKSRQLEDIPATEYQSYSLMESTFFSWTKI